MCTIARSGLCKAANDDGDKSASAWDTQSAMAIEKKTTDHVTESYPASVVCAGEKGDLQLAAASPARAPVPEPVKLAPLQLSTQPLDSEFGPA